MRRLAFTFLVMVLFGASGTSGAAAQQQAITLQGIVVEAGTNRPLNNVSLELRMLQEGSGPSNAPTNSPIPYFLATNFSVFPGLSGDSGQFAFRNVLPGRYSLTASHTGFMHAEYGQRGPNSKGVILTVAPGQPPPDIRLTMTRNGAISGHVFDSKGTPLAYVQVQMRRVTYPDGQRTLTTASSTVTDDQGTYRLYGLPPGSYVLSAETNTNSVGITPVAASRTPPVPGVVVFQSASGPMQVDADPANQNRRKDTGVLIFYPNATDVIAAKVIDIRPGDDIAGVNVTLNAIRTMPAAVTWAITGNSGSTNSIVDLVVSNTSAGGDVRNRYGIPAVMPGPFTYPLAPGTYLALAMERGTGGAPLTVGYAAFDAGATPAMRVNIAMSPTRDVSGHFVGDGSSLALNEADMTGLRINFRRDPPLPLLSGPPSAVPAKDGSFDVKGFIDGDWGVAVTGFPDSLRNAYVKAIHAANAEVSGNRLRIPAQPTGPMELEIVMSANGGQISGTANAESGGPLSNVTVLLDPEATDRRDLYRTFTTDSAGRFRFDGIAPGNYKVFAWEDVEADVWYNPAFMATMLDRGKAVRIAEGSRESVDVTAIR